MEPTTETTAPEDAAAQMLAECMAISGVVLEPILEATRGYAAARVAEGFSDVQARAMACDYHGVLCAMMRANL